MRRVVVLVVVAGIVPAADEMILLRMREIGRIVQVAGFVETGNRHAAALIVEKSVSGPPRPPEEQVRLDRERPGDVRQVVYRDAHAIASRTAEAREVAAPILAAPVVAVGSGDAAPPFERRAEGDGTVFGDDLEPSRLRRIVGLHSEPLRSLPCRSRPD